jgi:hypothetical protein
MYGESIRIHVAVFRLKQCYGLRQQQRKAVVVVIFALTAFVGVWAVQLHLNFGVSTASLAKEIKGNQDHRN